MTVVESGFAHVNGTILYYEAAGHGPHVVLIHGMSLDCRMWDDQFEVIASQHRVVRYDVRGFGRSAVPSSESYSHVGDLRALLGFLSVGRASLVGVSMGGGIAIDYALSQPAMVDALIPVDSRLSGWKTDPDYAAFLDSIRAEAHRHGVPAAREAWLRGPVFSTAMVRPDLDGRLVEMVDDYSGWHWLNNDPLRPIDPPALRQLLGIRLPTLVVIGERDFPDCQAITKTLGAKIPGARTEIIPHVGHLPNMEAPGEFNALVLDFMSRQ